MGDKAHIGLVDTHTEGDGGHHDHTVFAQKAVLIRLAHPAVQPGVVGQGIDAGIHQCLRHVLHPFARLAVDDSGVALVLALDEAQQLLHGLALLDDGVADVGAVKAADKGAGVLQLQAFQDVVAGQRVGRGGQRHARHARKALVQHRQRPVFGTEVVAPLADAVRLVNRKQAQLVALKQRIQQRQEARIRHPLGSRVQQRDVAAQQALLDLVSLLTAERGVQKGGVHPSLVQRAHLVVHQRDQRRDDDGHAHPGPLAGYRRDLVAQRLAAARGHQYQCVATVGHVLDDGLLRPAKLRVTKHLFQNGVAGLAG